MTTIPDAAASRTSPRKSRLFSVLKTFGILLILVVLVAGMAFGILFYMHPLWVIDEALHARLKMAGMESRFVQVGPYRVHYFVGGAGQPLLLIHGLGSRSEDWTPEIPAYVRHGFRVYAIDLLGCGRTDHPDIAYSMAEQAALIHGFLEAVGVPRTDVAGWSMGGWVALRFALDHPASVRRLVLMDSAGLRFETNLTPAIFEPRTVPELRRFEALLMPHPPWMPGFFSRALLGAMARNFPVVHRATESMLAGEGLLDDRLGNLQAPVLILWGEQDVLIPPSVAWRMHAAIPQSVLEIYRGCGHVGPAVCSGRMTPRVIEFLRSEPAASGGAYHY